MPPIVAAILAGVLGNLSTDAARHGLLIAMGRVRRPLGGPRVDPPPPRQTAPPRQVITPPVSAAPVGRSFEQPLSGVELAHRLRWRG